MSYTVEMHHNESSFTALSKMQYNLFCQRNLILRSLLSFTLLIVAIFYLSNWWAYLLIIYAVYLTSSTRMVSTRAARKLTEQLKKNGLDYPSSRLCFGPSSLRVTSLPKKKGEEDAVLPYRDVCKLAEDQNYYFVFRDQFGGYMVPKASLHGKESDFRAFLESKTGLTCYAGTSPLQRVFSIWRKSRNQTTRR